MRNIFFSVIGVVLFAPTSCLFGMDFAEARSRINSPNEQIIFTPRDKKELTTLKFQAAHKIAKNNNLNLPQDLKKYLDVVQKHKGNYKAFLQEAVTTNCDPSLVQDLIASTKFLQCDDEFKEQVIYAALESGNREMLAALMNFVDISAPGKSMRFLESFFNDFFVWNNANCAVGAAILEYKLKEFTATTQQKRSLFVCSGMNALECAIFVGSADHVKEFLPDFKNADIAAKKTTKIYFNQSVGDGITFFDLIHQKGYCDVANVLYEYVLQSVGPSLDAHISKKDTCGRTLLFYAVLADRLDEVKALVRCGLDVNAQDEMYRTPLFYCSSPQMAQLLIDSGANVNHLDMRTNTVLFTCASPAMVDFFVNAGVNINHTNCNRLFAVEENQNLDVIYRLIDLNADVKNTYQYFFIKICSYLERLSSYNGIAGTFSYHAQPAKAKKAYKIGMLLIDKLDIDYFIKDDNRSGYIPPMSPSMIFMLHYFVDSSGINSRYLCSMLEKMLKKGISFEKMFGTNLKPFSGYYVRQMETELLRSVSKSPDKVQLLHEKAGFNLHGYVMEGYPDLAEYIEVMHSHVKDEYKLTDEYRKEKEVLDYLKSKTTLYNKIINLKRRYFGTGFSGALKIVGVAVCLKVLRAYVRSSFSI